MRGPGSARIPAFLFGGAWCGSVRLNRAAEIAQPCHKAVDPAPREVVNVVAIRSDEGCESAVAEELSVL